MSKIIETEDLAFSYNENIGRQFELREVSIEIENNSFASVIGRNGSGKSTLIKLLAGQFGSYDGRILLAGKDIREYGRRELAGKLAYLPQSVAVVNDAIEVRELIMLGRYHSKRAFEFSNNPDDRRITDQCISQLGIENIAGMRFSDLSGGQRQKALIAMTLAQLDITSDLSEKVLIVDEPLTFLDVNHQYEVFNLLKKLNGTGLTIIAVIHDLNIALSFTEKCILMNNGSVVKSDNTSQVITENMLREHFFIESKITEYEKNFFINYIT